MSTRIDLGSAGHVVLRALPGLGAASPTRVMLRDDGRIAGTHSPGLARISGGEVLVDLEILNSGQVFGGAKVKAAEASHDRVRVCFDVDGVDMWVAIRPGAGRWAPALGTPPCAPQAGTPVETAIASRVVQWDVSGSFPAPGRTIKAKVFQVRWSGAWSAEWSVGGARGPRGPAWVPHGSGWQLREEGIRVALVHDVEFARDAWLPGEHGLVHLARRRGSFAGRALPAMATPPNSPGWTWEVGGDEELVGIYGKGGTLLRVAMYGGTAVLRRGRGLVLGRHSETVPAPWLPPPDGVTWGDLAWVPTDQDDGITAVIGPTGLLLTAGRDQLQFWSGLSGGAIVPPLDVAANQSAAVSWSATLVPIATKELPVEGARLPTAREWGTPMPSRLFVLDETGRELVPAPGARANARRRFANPVLDETWRRVALGTDLTPSPAGLVDVVDNADNSSAPFDPCTHGVPTLGDRPFEWQFVGPVTDRDVWPVLRKAFGRPVGFSGGERFSSIEPSATPAGAATWAGSRVELRGVHPGVGATVAVGVDATRPWPGVIELDDKGAPRTGSAWFKVPKTSIADLERRVFLTGPGLGAGGIKFTGGQLWERVRSSWRMRPLEAPQVVPYEGDPTFHLPEVVPSRIVPGIEIHLEAEPDLRYKGVSLHLDRHLVATGRWAVSLPEPVAGAGELVEGSGLNVLGIEDLALLLELKDGVLQCVSGRVRWKAGAIFGCDPNVNNCALTWDKDQAGTRLAFSGEWWTSKPRNVGQEAVEHSIALIPWDSTLDWTKGGTLGLVVKHRLVRSGLKKLGFYSWAIGAVDRSKTPWRLDISATHAVADVVDNQTWYTRILDWLSGTKPDAAPPLSRPAPNGFVRYTYVDALRATTVGLPTVLGDPGPSWPDAVGPWAHKLDVKRHESEGASPWYNTPDGGGRRMSSKALGGPAGQAPWSDDEETVTHVAYTAFATASGEVDLVCCPLARLGEPPPGLEDPEILLDGRKGWARLWRFGGVGRVDSARDLEDLARLALAASQSRETGLLRWWDRTGREHYWWVDSPLLRLSSDLGEFLDAATPVVQASFGAPATNRIYDTPAPLPGRLQTRLSDVTPIPLSQAGTVERHLEHAELAPSTTMTLASESAAVTEGAVLSTRRFVPFKAAWTDTALPPLPWWAPPGRSQTKGWHPRTVGVVAATPRPGEKVSYSLQARTFTAEGPEHHVEDYRTPRAPDGRFLLSHQVEGGKHKTVRWLVVHPERVRLGSVRDQVLLAVATPGLPLARIGSPIEVVAVLGADVKRPSGMDHLQVEVFWYDPTGVEEPGPGILLLTAEKRVQRDRAWSVDGKARQVSAAARFVRDWVEPAPGDRKHRMESDAQQLQEAPIANAHRLLAIEPPATDRTALPSPLPSHLGILRSAAGGAWSAVAWGALPSDRWTPAFLRLGDDGSVEEVPDDHLTDDTWLCWTMSGAWTDPAETPAAAHQVVFVDRSGGVSRSDAT